MKYCRMHLKRFVLFLLNNIETKSKRKFCVQSCYVHFIAQLQSDTYNEFHDISGHSLLIICKKFRTKAV